MATPPWTHIVIGIDSVDTNVNDSDNKVLEGGDDVERDVVVVEGSDGLDNGLISNVGKNSVWNKPADDDVVIEGSGEGNVGKKSVWNKPMDVVNDDDVVIEGSGDGNVGKKSVWNKPADVVNDDVSGLIGAAAAWPALSELTKASPKSSSSNFPVGSSSVPQLAGMSSSQRQGSNMKANSSSHMNNAGATRQRSSRQGNVGGSGNHSSGLTANGGFSLVPPSQRPANPESLSGENPHREGVGQRGGYVPQSNSGIEHQQRNSHRRGLGGPHPRGDGSQYHNHGGRRDQDRNTHRNFGGRGAHMQPPRVSTRPFLRGPPPANTSYLPPPMPLHPSFGTPMVYPGPEVFYFPGPPQDPFRPGPMVPPMGPVFYPLFDPLLQTKILNQIEYYFSTGNLIIDTYLRRNMDEHGWVSIKLVAGFNKLSELTDNIQLIMAAVQSSNVVEIEGDKIRRRDDWQKWILPPSVQHIQQSGQENLAMGLRNVALGERV